MIKPADVLVLFALVSEREPWTLRSLAGRLGVPLAKVQRGLDRLAAAGIYDASRQQVVPAAAQEFVLHALRYLQPIREGALVRGVPTAWAASPLSDEISSSGEAPPVWPSPQGSVRGPAVEPLDAAVPGLVSSWPEVAELAALADALRLGDSRTRDAAARHLRERLA